MGVRREEDQLDVSHGDPAAGLRVEDRPGRVGWGAQPDDPLFVARFPGLDAMRRQIDGIGRAARRAGVGPFLGPDGGRRDQDGRDQLAADPEGEEDVGALEGKALGLFRSVLPEQDLGELETG